jgi:purine-binding chemotaxis protein CheW
MGGFERVGNEHITGAPDRTRFLTFRLAHEQYGIEILKVHEVTCVATITPVPGMQPHLKGVVNLEGASVPVVDLRSSSADETDPFSVIIVVKAGARVMGLLVDGVAEVLTISTVHSPATPDIKWAVDARYVGGVGKAGDTLVRVLDIDRLLDAMDELAVVTD